jgi:monoamine oxidase
MDPILDVAIAGGGVSGVYAAYRLQGADPTRSPILRQLAAARPDGRIRVAVYERSARIGGRLLSVRAPGMPGLVCELGGMRYLSTHALVRGLVERELGLRTRDFVVERPENLVFLRGVRRRSRDLGRASGLPYNLTWAERETPPGNLLGYAVDQFLPGLTKLHGDALVQRLRRATLDGVPLWRHGFWNLIARSLSHEAYVLARDVSGYDCLALNWNAVDTVPECLDFVPGVTYRAFENGYEEVPLLLAEKFRQLGGTVHHGTTLTAFDTATLPDGSTGVALVLRGASGEAERVLARSLILAMPRRSIELLEPTGAVLGPANTDVRALLRSAAPAALFKLFLCYASPWWEAAGVSRGRSLTDLPLRQVYYWGSDPSTGHAAILIYDDMGNADFWAGLRDEDADPYPSPPGPETGPALPGWDRYAAPRAMVEEAHRQLVELHGLRHAPAPYAAAFMDWADDPFGGGVHFWNIHVKSWELIPRIAQPKPALPVYICGEAYSDTQTWVEGALQTAELVLQKHFALPPPAWLEG